MSDLRTGRTVPGVVVLTETSAGILGQYGGRLVRLDDEGRIVHRGDPIFGGFEGALTLASRGVWNRLARRRVFAVGSASVEDGSRVILHSKSMLHIVDVSTACVVSSAASPARRTLFQGIARGPRGDVLFSPYSKNPGRQPVEIFRMAPDLEGLAVRNRLTGIRHVHSIQTDPYGGDLWITTGDADDECRIGRLGAPGEEPDWIGGGSQDWRAVSLQFTADSIWWGTDDPHGANRFFRWDRDTGERTVVGSADRPIYYSARIGRHLAFFSTVEGPGVERDARARVWLAVDGSVIDAGVGWRKDRLSTGLFGYGLVEPAHREHSVRKDTLWVTAWGFKRGLHSRRLDLCGG